MKKSIAFTFILLVAFAVQLSAEAGFSGSFKYGLNYDLEAEDPDKEFVEVDNSVKITVDGTVNDFTSISAEITADEGDDLNLGSLVLSQDVSGALGVTGPVSFSFKVGKQSYSPPNYSTAYETGAKVGVKVEQKKDDKDLLFSASGKMFEGDTETTIIEHQWAKGKVTLPGQGSDSNLIGLVTTLGVLDIIYLDLALYPQTYFDGDDNSAEFSAALYGTIGNVNIGGAYSVSRVSAYRDKKQVLDMDGDNPKPRADQEAEGDLIDNAGDNVSFSVGWADFGAKAGLTVRYDMEEDDETLYYRAVGKNTKGEDVEGDYKWTESFGSKLSAAVDGSYMFPFGLGFGLGYKINNVLTDDFDFAADSDLSLDIDYNGVENLSVHVDFDLGSFSAIMADASAKLTASYGFGDTTVYGAAKLGTFEDFKVADDLTYEAGVMHALDGVTFNVGYTSGSDFKAYYDEDDHAKGVFLTIAASF